MKPFRQSGFTLIELLVVIAIIAILAIVVVLTLNPAQLLQQARDSNRISDLATIKSAIGYYMQDVSSPQTGIGPGAGSLWSTNNICYEDGPVKTGTQTVATDTCPWFVNAGTMVLNSSSSRVTNATSGWIPINLSLISIGAPIGQWPVDPANAVNGTGGFATSTDHFYSFAGTSSTSNFFYKLGANMESTKYSLNGTADVESTDGGTYSNVYEQGTNLQL